MTRRYLAACNSAVLAGSLITMAAMHATAGTAAASDARVRRYVQIAPSPDAAYVADIEGELPKGGTSPPLRELMVRRVKDRAVTAVALPCGRVPQCWPTSLAWTPDGKELSFTLRLPGTHTYAIYSVAADGSRLRRRLEFNGTLTDLRYSRNGMLAVLATESARKEVGATEAGAPLVGDLEAPPIEQRIATVIDGQLRWVSPDSLFVYEYDWLPNGRALVGTAAPGDGDDNWWSAKLYKFQLEPGAAQLQPGAAQLQPGAAQVIYAPTDTRQQITRPRVSPDGRTVAFIGGLMSDFGSTGGDVFTTSIEGGTATDAMPGMNASAIAIGWTCSGRLRAQLLAGDQDQLVDFDLRSRSPVAHILSSTQDTWDGTDSGSLAVCPSGVLATVRQSFTTPPEILTGTPGNLQALTAENSGLTAPFEVTSVKWTLDGFDQVGWLVSPAHPAGRIPLVTIVHGGPAAVAQPLFTGPGLQRDLLERGWAVFRPNPRGSFGEGERFTRANIRDFGYGDLRDILAGIDAAERLAPIDEERLGLTGGSYGGYMTMWAITQTQRFKAAVAAAGVSDWLSYYGENGIDGWMIPFFGASVYDDPAIYARSSPINFVKRARTPTFFYVGERDIEVPPAQTEEMWRALRTLGVPTSVVIYPGEGHGLRNPANAEDAENRTLAWFDRYLKAAAR